MTIVYVDSLFFINLGLDGLLLSAARQLGGVSGRWWRTLLAAVLGALYSAVTICAPWKVSPVVHVLAAGAMVLVAVGRAGQPLRVLLLFLLLSCALAGGILLLQACGVGRWNRWSALPATISDAQMLLLCVGGEYVVVTLFHALPKPKSQRIVPVLVSCCGRKSLFRVLVDTGNELHDPATGAPVIVVSRSAVLPLFGEGILPTVQELSSPVYAMERLSRTWCADRLRLVPYQAVGVASGLLLTIRVDDIEVSGQPFHSQLLAVIGDSFPAGYEGLIGAEQGGRLSW